MSGIHRRLRALALLGAAALSPCALAVTYTWPAGPLAPCGTSYTLQNCVNGVPNGSTILIAANNINEDIDIVDRSVTLASKYQRTEFVPGRHIAIDGSNASGDLHVGLSKLYFTAAGVTANYHGSGTATYEFSDLVISGAGVPAEILVIAEGHIVANLLHNRVHDAQSWGIETGTRGGTLEATLSYNRVENSGDGIGIFAYGDGASQAGSVHAVLDGNVVAGAGYFGLQAVASGAGGSAPGATMTLAAYNNVATCATSAGGGFDLAIDTADITAQVINNTVSHCGLGMQWRRASGASGTFGSSVLENNLIAAVAPGLSIDATAGAGISEGHNLIVAGYNYAPLDASDITDTADLVADVAPRLRAGSKAIDAADDNVLQLGLAANALPDTDGDGLRRFKGIHADIGAYEYGDSTFTQDTTAANIVGDHTIMNFPALNGDLSPLLIATPDYNAGLAAGVDYDHPLGTYFSNGTWRLFGEDISAMPSGTHFDVWVPALGDSTFSHVSSSSSTANATHPDSLVDDVSLNGQPDRFVLVTQNWTSGGASKYNAHPVGVYYGADTYWHVDNLDGAAMGTALGFNVYAQDPSPNAFVVTADAINTGGALGTDYLQLDHPLLTGIPCARPHVTRIARADNSVSGNFTLVYDPAGYGFWNIHTYGPLATGDRFFVLVDPGQVFDCTDRVFANGFQ